VPYLEFGSASGGSLGTIDGLGYVGERIEAILSMVPR
jgi:hypothetical protein